MHSISYGFLVSAKAFPEVKTGFGRSIFCWSVLPIILKRGSSRKTKGRFGRMILTIIVLILVTLCLLMPLFGIPVSPTRRQGLSTLFFPLPTPFRGSQYGSFLFVYNQNKLFLTYIMCPKVDYFLWWKGMLGGGVYGRSVVCCWLYGLGATDGMDIWVKKR